MTPTILVVGATGNTGGGVLHTLSSDLKGSKLEGHRIVGLTRDKNGGSAKKLAELPHVEMMEKDWTMINADWLQENEVKRIFLASHNGVSHFTDESLFLNYALDAGVEYVVRISTTAGNIGPATRVFYGRNHWAVETMLEQPEFNRLKWTSLRPNVFTPVFTQAATAWLSEFKSSGKQTTFKCMTDADGDHAMVDPFEVGIFAGKLLAREDVSPHASKKYIIVGPSDLTGKDIVKVIEKHAGVKVEDVKFKDRTFADGLKGTGYPENVIPSLSLAPVCAYDGKVSTRATPTSPELLKLYTPKNHALEAIDAALSQV